MRRYYEKMSLISFILFACFYAETDHWGILLGLVISGALFLLIDGR